MRSITPTILSLVTLLSLNAATFAQDSLFTNQGQALRVSVEEIGVSELRYKLHDGQAPFGPMRVIAKQDVRMVKYANGMAESFATQQPATATQGDMSSVPAPTQAPPPPPKPMSMAPAPVASMNEVPVAPAPQPYVQAPRPVDTSATLTRDIDKNKVALTYTQNLASDTIRKSWLEKGGTIGSSSAGAQFVYMDMSAGSSSISMMGLGCEFTSSWLRLSPPNYDKQVSSWNAFVFGGGFNIQYTTGSGDLGSNMSMDMTSTTMSLKTPIGFTLGLGGFKPDHSWGGAAVSLTWAPSLQLNSNDSKLDMGSMGYQETKSTDISLNLGGFGAAIDFGSFDKAMSQKAKNAHFSIFGFVIPKTSKTPFMLSIGIAWLTYSELGG